MLPEEWIIQPLPTYSPTWLTSDHFFPPLEEKNMKSPTRSLSKATGDGVFLAMYELDRSRIDQPAYTRYLAALYPSSYLFMTHQTKPEQSYPPCGWYPQQ